MNKQIQDWQEYRRFQAYELHQQGWNGNRIAEALGVTKSAVSQWLSKARAGGKEALRARKAEGPTPKLSQEQREKLPELLARGPQAYGFEGEVWTCSRVTKVIKQVYGVQYHPAHTSRILKTLAWTPQKPEVKASQRDEAAIEAWREERWPVLKKSS